MAIVAVALEVGFSAPPLPRPVLHLPQLLAVLAYLAARVVELTLPQKREQALRSLAVDGVAGCVVAAVVIAVPHRAGSAALKVSTVYVAVVQGLLVLRLLIAAVRWNVVESPRRLQPARAIVVTFLMLIACGTLVLALPRATAPDLHERADFSIPRHVVNCLFTAVSATCVTGLVVYDTGRDFTLLGQTVILLLMQLGGLGIMVFGSAVGLLVGRQLSLRQSLVLQDALSHRTISELAGMLRFIVAFTFVSEAVGAVILFTMWPGDAGLGQRLFSSVFHAVSAFCNAGFSLQSDSLVGYRGAWQVYAAICPLIVLGGLGFPVLYDLWRGAVAAGRSVARRWQRGLRPGHAVPAVRFSLHTRLALRASLWLIVVPAVLVAVIEAAAPAPAGGRFTRSDTLAGGTWPERLRDGLFLSVTARTAGFNTVAMGPEDLTPATHLITVVLMFVGGSPGSTAGGIKTTTACVVVLSVICLLRGRQDVEVLGRSIPAEVVRRAVAVTLLMASLVTVTTIGLTVTESVSLREALFESASAAGTVGLTTGITPSLTVGGRVLIMAAMFIGRLGPVAVMIALAGQAPPARFRYPPEPVGIG